MKVKTLEARKTEQKNKRFTITGHSPIPENFHQWPSPMRLRFLRLMEKAADGG